MKLANSSVTSSLLRTQALALVVGLAAAAAVAAMTAPRWSTEAELVLPVRAWCRYRHVWATIL